MTTITDVSTLMELFGLPVFKNTNLVPRAFPFLSLGSREKALAPGGLLCILIGQ
jgi:hypothetical protein